MSRRDPDPLAVAISTDTLNASQRAALADLAELLAFQMAGDAVVRPRTLMEHTIDEAGRWGTLRDLWRERRRDLYPQAVTK